MVLQNFRTPALNWCAYGFTWSFDITVMNQHASTAETGAIVINFAVVKAVTS